jgi:rubrerythrin
MAADVGILNVALGLEFEAINAYQLDAQLAKVAGRLAADETMHWTILNNALGRPLPADALPFGA